MGGLRGFSSIKKIMDSWKSFYHAGRALWGHRWWSSLGGCFPWGRCGRCRGRRWRRRPHWRFFSMVSEAKFVRKLNFFEAWKDRLIFLRLLRRRGTFLVGSWLWTTAPCRRSGPFRCSDTCRFRIWRRGDSGNCKHILKIKLKTIFNLNQKIPKSLKILKVKSLSTYDQTS